MKLLEVHGRFDKYHEDRPLQYADMAREKPVKWNWDQSRLVIEVPYDLPWGQDHITRKLVHSDGIFYIYNISPEIIEFYHHIHDLTQNTGGFGGSTYRAHLEDGTIEDVPGPWSSSSIHYNELFPEKDWVIDVTIKPLGSTYASRGGYITVKRARNLLRDTPYRIVFGKYNDPHWAEIIHKDDIKEFEAEVARYASKNRKTSATSELSGNQASIVNF